MKHNSTRLISLADALSFVLPRCYVLVIGALVGAALLVMYGYRDNKKLLNQDAEDYSTDASLFSEEDMEEIQNAIDAKKTLDDLEAYYNRSYIYKVDPLAVESVSFYYKVDLDTAKFPEDKAGQEGTYINNIRNEYTQYVTKSALASDVGNMLGIDNECISELITAENEGNDKLLIIVRAVDQVEGMTEAIKKSIASKNSDVTSNYFSHTFALYDTFTSTVRIDDFYNKQKAVNPELNNCKYNLDIAIKNLDKHQLAYYNEQTGDERLYIDPDTGDETERYISKAVKDYIKYAILGAIAGFVVSAIGLVCLMAYSKKIICLSDYKVSLGLNVIGNIKNIDDDAAIGQALAIIVGWCNKNDVDKICLTSSLPEILEDKRVLDITQKLEKENINVTSVDSVTKNYQDLQKMIDVGTAVQIEKMRKSQYRDLVYALELYVETEVKLLGVINLG